MFRSYLSGAGGKVSLARRGLGLAAAVLLLAALLAACGIGGDDDDDANENAVMSTFTPAPPDYTPEALQTRAARATEFAAESTTRAGTTPTPPSGPSAPSGSPSVGTPQSTPQEGEVRPPDAIMQTSSGELTGAIGSFNFIDPEIGNGADITAPYVPIAGDALAWIAGSPAVIEVPNSPFAVGSATIDIYVYDDNVALPQSQGGVPTGEVAFYPQTDPSDSQTVEGPELVFTSDIAPGDYIVAVRIDWDAPADIVQRFGEQHTQYVYVVQVQ